MEAWVAPGVDTYHPITGTGLERGAGSRRLRISIGLTAPSKNGFRNQESNYPKIPFGIKLQRGPTLRKQLFNEGTLGILYFL